jgi:hypothetical protein
MLRLGSKLTAELNHIGHPSGLSHFAFTSAFVNSSSAFSSNGLTCLSISTDAEVLVLLPKLATIKRPTKGSLMDSCTEIEPEPLLSNT